MVTDIINEVFMFFYIFIAVLSPFFYASAVLIESMLSNNTFKRQTTMIFYISLMNIVFLPLILIFGFPTILGAFPFFDISIPSVLIRAD